MSGGSFGLCPEAASVFRGTILYALYNSPDMFCQCVQVDDSSRKYPAARVAGGAHPIIVAVLRGTIVNRTK